MITAEMCHHIQNIQSCLRPVPVSSRLPAEALFQFSEAQVAREILGGDAYAKP